MAAGLLSSAAAAQPDAREAIRGLSAATFAEKEQIVDALGGRGDPSGRAALGALLDGRLFVRDRDGQIFVVRSADDDVVTFELEDPVSLAPAGSASRDDMTRITTNNRLRRRLRELVARFDLASPDAAVRLEAVKSLVAALDDRAVAALRARAAVERNGDVKDEIEVGLALASLDAGDARERLVAIATLSRKLRPQVRNRLAALLETDDAGRFVERDAQVRDAAARAVRAIDRARAIYGGIETLFFGLSAGSVLALVAVGLAITFGVMGVINMAHGELMMLGAYTTFVMERAMPHHIGLAVIVAVPAAFLVAGAAGIAIERSVIRLLYGRPLETLLATFGVSLVLQQLVRSVFSANNRSVATPAWMSGTLQINGALALTMNRLCVIAFTLIVFAILPLLLRRTRLGLHIRAVSQNRAMARALGIRTGRVDALTFGLGSGIAGAAGVALSQLTNVGPNLGQSYIIDSFMVVVFGGVGSLWGTLAGGMSMGIIDQLLEPYVGAVLAKIAVLVALIVFIQRWPRGLFPLTGRAAEADA